MNYREPKGTIASIVKAIPLSEIQEVLKQLPIKTQPRAHQARSLYLSLDQPRWLFALDMGLGKTKLGLDIIATNKSFKGRIKALVTCPPIVLRQWQNEALKHSDLTVQLINASTGKGKLSQLFTADADIVVVSHTWLVVLFSQLEKDPQLAAQINQLFKEFDILIVDEAHVLKNPKTKSFKGYRKYLMHIKKCYLMTGTPIGNNYTGVWSLYYLLDQGFTFGLTYGRFLHRYFRSYFNGRYTRFILKGHRQKEFMLNFWNKCIRWEETECNDLPEKNYIPLPIELTPTQAKIYDELVLNTVDMQETIEFALMRITAGIDLAESPKLDAVKQIVADVCLGQNRPLIVWCWLQEESDYLVSNLTKAFKDLTIRAIKGSGTKKAKDIILDQWATGNVDILIANQKSLGVGLDLYEANVCCFFSNNRSLIDRKQAEKRIHRTGQTRPCTYIDLICEKTIDEINFNIVQRANNLFTELTKDKDVDIVTLVKNQRKL